ncbi:hypothetical protein [Alloalcanivorax xenomutans]|uniref:hypothetical protein n=1 Tax=Alloalcanivorax xenomutans TaxID=1094342 RepID=UPI0006D8344E|nr:hypothetical protein [Alloalcanivorax xenomutans]
MSDEMIMFDSPEAAQPYTMTGWKSRDGFFFANERDARYAGCTHRPCTECGKPARKLYTLCAACRADKDNARYEAMPLGEWDGRAVLYSEASDRFFSDIEDAECSLEEGQSLADLQLVICEPNYACQLDEDFFCDDMTEDGDLPDHIVTAIEEFNAAIAGTVLSWSPGKYRLNLEEHRDD